MHYLVKDVCPFKSVCAIVMAKHIYFCNLLEHVDVFGSQVLENMFQYE